MTSDDGDWSGKDIDWPNNPNVLSQSEVDALLKGIEGDFDESDFWTTPEKELHRHEDMLQSRMEEVNHLKRLVADSQARLDMEEFRDYVETFKVEDLKKLLTRFRGVLYDNPSNHKLRLEKDVLMELIEKRT